MTLNPEQHSAATHKQGPCIVTAVPGSGKTRTLTSRVVWLIKEGVPASNILCLTFTNKAANEMRERVAIELGEDSNSIYISTFHSFFLAVLRKFGSEIGLAPGFSVYGDGDQRELIEKITRMHEYETNRAGINRIMKAANDFREDLVDFANITGELRPIEISIVKEYLDTLKTFNAVDFSGILSHTYDLLKKRPKSAEILANRFKYVLVDEWQDTNTIQYEALKLIAKHHNNLFVVGDPCQSIFAWRGAKPENIDRVRQDFENVKDITLPRNYRSTKQILANAERLIRHNANAKNVKLISEVGDGDPVNFWTFITPEMESTAIATTIAELCHRKNLEWRDFAVLYRMNALSKTPEMEFRKFNIPYKIYGGFSFFDRREIKASMSYFKFTANPKDTHAFTKAIKLPARGVGDATIGRLERYCQDNSVDMLTACKNNMGIKMPANAREGLQSFVNVIEKYQKKNAEGVALRDIAEGLLTESGFYEHMKTESKQDQDWQKRIDNIHELLVDIADYSDRNPKSRLGDYLQAMELITSDEKDETDNAVSLLTMHSAKGLEFPVVFVIGVEKNIIPHKSALAEGREDEERRLMYVAATRAKQCLFLSHCQLRKQWKGRTEATDPSHFLYEMNPNFAQ